MLFLIKHYRVVLLGYFLQSILKDITTINYFWNRMHYRSGCSNFLSHKDPVNEQSFDFIIVGAGTAGSILASRLSEYENYSVLLLETGGKGSFLEDIPVALSFMQRTHFDWQYRTEPQNHSCFAMKEKRSVWPRGKVVGGSSRLNYMIYMRGHHTDFKSWRNPITKSWNFDEITHYFKKSERQTGRYKKSSDHGTDGLIYVEDLAFETGLTNALLNASWQLGHPKYADLNDMNSTGFMKSQVTTKDSARWSGEHVLNDAMRKRTNLIVKPMAFVEKVLVNSAGEAYGVKFHTCAMVQNAYAKKSVILSAGTVNTPKILMMSGIGPRNELKRFKIPLVKDLPVGQNLQDHLTTGLDLVLVDRYNGIDVDHFLYPFPYYDYFVHGKGLLTYSGCEIVGLMRSKYQDASSSPDIQMLGVNIGVGFDGGWKLFDNFGFRNNVWNEYFKKWTGLKYPASISPVLLHPKSRGYVTLASADVWDDPIIQPNYLSHPEDVEILIEGIRHIQRLVNTPSMKRFGAKFNFVMFPGCEHLEFDSGAYWNCYVRHMTLTVYHPVGTCKMGYPADQSSVVDHDLKVIGIRNLHVIDASIMPNLPSGNTNAATAMIAEKGADILKRIWYDHYKKCSALEPLFGIKSV